MPNFKFKPTLTSPDRTVQLRPFTADNADRMLDILAQPLVSLYTGSSDHTPAPAETFPANTADTARIRTWYATRSDQNDRLDLAIVQNGTLIGEVVLNLYDAENNSCNLRILIADDATEHGAGQATFALILPYAFLALGLNTLTLDAFEFNQRAIHVYHKVGFKDVGTIPDDLELDGKSVTSIKMALTAADFLQS